MQRDKKLYMSKGMDLKVPGLARGYSLPLKDSLLPPKI